MSTLRENARPRGILVRMRGPLMTPHCAFVMNTTLHRSDIFLIPL